MSFQVWFLPIMLLSVAVLMAFPLSRYLAWIMDGKYRPHPILARFENRLNTGAQTWKQYLSSMLIFSTVLFIFSFFVLALQPWLPLNPASKTLLAPSTIFNSAASFMTNTDLQHYVGEQHLSNFSQIFFCIANMFLSAAMGMAALTAIIRALRGDPSLGNFFLDIWRVVVYLFLPVAFIFALIFMQQGSPMTFKSAYQVTTLEQGQQTIVVGPVAALESIKLLGSNGGGFYATNSAHPFENPTGLSNFFNTIASMIFPMAIVLMYGRLLGQERHSRVIFITMFALMVVSLIWSVYFDTLKPNPGLTKHPTKTFAIPAPHLPTGKKIISVPTVAGLPVDQHLGNLEGKELRFGTSAAAVTAVITDDATCGATNAELDSFNPLATLASFLGLWLSCIFGGKGAGMINLVLFVIIGIFFAGLMVGRTPEYLGKKISGREIKLAIIGLLVHPIMILFPIGLFVATPWGMHAISNPAAHGFSQILYQFSSASANNGSAYDGLNVTYGFYNNPNPAPEAVYWDISTGLSMIFSRYLPIIAMVAVAAFLGEKKSCPFGLGTLRVDTVTFGFMLLGTILIVGTLLFFPVAVLGPVAEHLAPMPFTR